MRVYLLNPPYRGMRIQRDMRWQDSGKAGTMHWPGLISYATGILEQAGHICRLVDAPANHWDAEILKDDIANFNPDFIVINTCFPTLEDDIEFAKVPKSINNRMSVCMVGVATSQYPDKMMESENVDYLAKFEFDFVLRDLLNAIEKHQDLSQVKGISYKDEQGKVHHNEKRPWSTPEELDSLPFVVSVYKRHLDVHHYMLNYSYALYPEVQILSSRGCPSRCLFCVWTEDLMGRTYRHRTASNVLDEFEWVVKNMPEVKQVFIEDDSFTINKQYVMEFCKGYKERGLKMPWGCQSRVEVDLETMVAMRKANCLHVDVGYESGDDQILQNVKKGIKVEDIKRFDRDARKAHLSVHGNWIIGLPGETKETIAKTKKLIKEVKRSTVTIAIASPFPGTGMYSWAKENGYLLNKDYLDGNGHQQCILSYPNLSNVEIEKEAGAILKDYFVSWSYIPVAFQRVFSRHGFNELKVLWKSSVAFTKYLIKNRKKKHAEC